MKLYVWQWLLVWCAISFPGAVIVGTMLDRLGRRR